VTGARRPESIRAAWVAAGAVVVVMAIVAIVVWQSSDGASSNGRADGGVLTDVGSARAPFQGLTAGTITVGGRALRVVVADDEDERVQGLREKSDASPYDGMLFVFPSDGLVSFTMATVPDALQIVFFDAAGRVVDRLRMAPCPNGTDATCPLYTPKRPFRYALETRAGVEYHGSLAVG
jgi:uncharacterized membrane protein (UPF0127 family)